MNFGYFFGKSFISIILYRILVFLSTRISKYNCLFQFVFFFFFFTLDGNVRNDRGGIVRLGKSKTDLPAFFIMITANPAGVVFLAFDGSYDETVCFSKCCVAERAVTRMIMKTFFHICVRMERGVDRESTFRTGQRADASSRHRSQRCSARGSMRGTHRIG